MAKIRKFARLLSAPNTPIDTRKIRVIPGRTEKTPTGSQRDDVVEIDGTVINGTITTVYRYGTTSVHTVSGKESVEGQNINWLLVKNGRPPHPDYKKL